MQSLYPKFLKTDDRALEPSSMSLMIQRISQAETLSDVSDTLIKFNAHQTYENVHMGLCKLDNLPVKDIIHSCPISGLGLSVSDFDDDLKWAICAEAEYLLRPFDLLTHAFQTSDTRLFDDLRMVATQFGLKQIMIIPMRVKNTIIVTILNFPNADFETQAVEILPQFYQLSLALFERFPKLLTWSKTNKLTLREAEILSLSAKGLTVPDIAKECGISINTVRNHVENSKLKLNARNKLHAVMLALETHEIERVNNHELRRTG